MHSVVGDFIHSVDDIGDVAVKAALQCGIGKEGKSLVITAGMPFGKVGSTNIVGTISKYDLVSTRACLVGFFHAIQLHGSHFARLYAVTAARGA